jgi:SAM-dependent methyltransferase
MGAAAMAGETCNSPHHEAVRLRSFGQGHTLTVVDRFGAWLSATRIRKEISSFDHKRVGDLGCGYYAIFARSILRSIDSALLVDVAIASDLKKHPKVQAIEGPLPDVLSGMPSGSLDIILCTSVLEHLWNPLALLTEIHRLLDHGGCCLLNVPSWRGKRFLEYSAFKLGMSPRTEMDDHKMYYDVKDLWPLLVKAGFLPHNVRCFLHKWGLNTFAVCRLD